MNIYTSDWIFETKTKIPLVLKDIVCVKLPQKFIQRQSYIMFRVLKDLSATIQKELLVDHSGQYKLTVKWIKKIGESNNDISPTY